MPGGVVAFAFADQIPAAKAGLRIDGQVCCARPRWQRVCHAVAAQINPSQQAAGVTAIVTNKGPDYCAEFKLGQATGMGTQLGVTYLQSISRRGMLGSTIALLQRMGHVCSPLLLLRSRVVVDVGPGQAGL